MSGFQGYLTKELPVKQRDMATLKNTHQQLLVQAAKKKGPAVPEEFTFELLEAEWTGLERENKECQIAMERELRRSIIHVHKHMIKSGNTTSCLHVHVRVLTLYRHVHVHMLQLFGIVKAAYLGLGLRGFLVKWDILHETDFSHTCFAYYTDDVRLIGTPHFAGCRRTAEDQF